MAVVSAVTTLRIDNSVSHADSTALTWVATAAAQDTAAGSSVLVTITHTNGGGVTPANAETLTLRYVTDGGIVIKTVSLNPTASSQTDTFYFTDTGNSGGSPRCGTIEIKLQATRTTIPTYDFETDGSPNTPPAGFHAHTLNQGWIRGTTTRAEEVSNVSLGGALTEPAEYDESLFVRLTEGAISYTARALTVTSSSGSLSSATNSTTAAQRDVTFTNVVDERFPAAVTNVTWSVTVPNAALTGVPDWTATTTAEADLDVDPRLTCTHHFQIDNNTFSLAADDNSNQMLATESGFLWTRITGSRGTGLNGITLTQTLTPTNPGTAVGPTSSVTSTRDSQIGWSDKIDWTASKPGGTWTKTVDITAPTDIDGSTYLLNSSEVLTMLAPDSRITVIASGGPTDKAKHYVAGNAFQVGVSIYKAAVKQVIPADSDGAGGHKAYAILARLEDTGAHAGRSQYLDSDGITWVPITGPGQTAYLHQLTQTRPDSMVYTKTIPAEQTEDWGDYDIFVIGEVFVSGTPYSSHDKEIVVKGFNNHNEATSSGAGGGATRLITVNEQKLAKRRKRLEDLLERGITDPEMQNILTSLINKHQNKTGETLNDDEEAMLYILLTINQDE